MPPFGGTDSRGDGGGARPRFESDRLDDESWEVSSIALIPGPAAIPPAAPPAAPLTPTPPLTLLSANIRRRERYWRSICCSIVPRNVGGGGDRAAASAAAGEDGCNLLPKCRGCSVGRSSRVGGSGGGGGGGSGGGSIDSLIIDDAIGGGGGGGGGGKGVSRFDN